MKKIIYLSLSLLMFTGAYAADSNLSTSPLKRKKSISFEAFLVRKAFDKYKSGNGKTLADFEPTYSDFLDLSRVEQKKVLQQGADRNGVHPFLEDRINILANAILLPIGQSRSCSPSSSGESRGSSPDELNG